MSSMSIIKVVIATFTLGLLLICCDGPPSLVPDGGPGDTDSGTDGDSDGDTDSDSDSDSDSDACDEYEDFYEGEYVAAGALYYGTSGGHFTGAYDIINGESGSWSALSAELLNGSVGSTNLSTQSDLQTCDRCVLWGKECSGQYLSECELVYLATAGEFEITEIDEDVPWEGQLAFEAHDLELSEAEINWNDYSSQLVEGGDVLCVGNWVVETAVEDWN